MTDPSQDDSAHGLTISDEIRAQYPDLIDLIVHSESMNDEERQYWINILPIMTPEQVQNLRDILENERKQLDAIDKKYAKNTETVASAEDLRQKEVERQKTREERIEKESMSEQKEEAAAEDLLKKIEDL